MFGQSAIGQLPLGQPEDEFPLVVEPVIGYAEFFIQTEGLADFEWSEQVEIEVEITP